MGSVNSKPIKLKKILNKKSEEFSITPEVLHLGKTLSCTLFDILRKRRKDVDRVVLIERIWHKSSLSNTNENLRFEPDFEFVVFINFLLGPLYTGTIFDLAFCLQEDPKIIVTKTSGFGISFTMKELSMKLYPAPNHRGIFTHQYVTIIEEMNKVKINQSQITALSYGLCEYYCEFIAEQSQFAQVLIRLAIRWTAGLSNKTFMTGRNQLIEIIALKAVQMCKKKLNIEEALFKFLFLVADFNALDVQITHRLFDRSRFPFVIKNLKPLVLNPVNPYVNMADNVPFHVREEYESKAKEMIQLLSEIKAKRKDKRAALLGQFKI